MNFKDEYKKDYEAVKLDDDFKNNLVAKMNKEPKKKKVTYIYASITVTAAAALAIVVGLSNNNNPGQKIDTITHSGDVGIMVEGNTTANLSGNDLSVKKWYGEAKNDEEKLEVFCGLITEENLETLYESDEETFSKENVLNEKDSKDILEMLLKAEMTDKEFTGKWKNYMAVFESGEIVKFKISDEGFVKFNDMDKNCKVK